MVFTIFDMKQLRKINPHGTDVKTNEDMYPLSRDFFFLSFLLFFFISQLSRKVCLVGDKPM